MISEMIRGMLACRLSGLSGCSFWWRTKNPNVMDDTLDAIFDIDHLGREMNLVIGGMSNRDGWDFIHNKQIAIDTCWEKHKYWCSVIAYDGGRVPNYFLVPSILPLSLSKRLDWGEAYRSVRPSQDISSEVDRLAADLLVGRVLGIHVRRTDRFREARVSTEEAYFRRIDAMAGSYDRIFLATDEPNIETSFSDRYGSMLVHTGKPKVQKWGGYKGRKTFVNLSFYRDAVIDMWLLSRCDRIIGSYRSSFSKVAARVSSNPDIKISIAM
jgi:hypothetical protein